MTAAPAPAIKGIVESILYVDDLARATAFYRDVLGLVPLAGDRLRFQVFQTSASQVLILFLRGATLAPVSVAGGIIPPHDSRGPHHIGLAIANADYEAWRAQLQVRGVAIESEATWPPGGRSLYFRDPDGHLLELVTPGIWPNY